MYMTIMFYVHKYKVSFAVTYIYVLCLCVALILLIAGSLTEIFSCFHSSVQIFKIP